MMKSSNFKTLAGLFLLAGVLSLKAGNGTWTSNADGNWSNTANWLGGAVADGDTFTADFSTIDLTADRTVTLDGGHTLSVLKFGDTTPDHNWTLSGANTLTLGTTPVIKVVNQTANISALLAGTAFTKAGLGVLTLNGSAANTFIGTMGNQGWDVDGRLQQSRDTDDLVNNTPTAGEW